MTVLRIDDEFNLHRDCHRDLYYEEMLKRAARHQQRVERFKKIGYVGFLLAILTAIMMVIVGNAHAADLAVGDSIALGTGQALRVQTVAVSSMGSCAIKGFAPSGSFAHVVISAGINDAPGSCIEGIRAKYAGAKVVWILPAAINSARAHVAAVAAANGDATVSYTCFGGCTKSNFHPGSYPAVAAAVRKAWGLRFGNHIEGVALPGPIPAAAVVAPTMVGREIIPAPYPPVVVAPVAASKPSFFKRLHDFFLPPKVSEIIRTEAVKVGVPVELALRVARVESHGQCNVTGGGAQGAMQVNPATAHAMGVHGNLHDCRTGIVAGVRYLHVALQKARGNWTVAAAYYNGGLGAGAHATRYTRLVMAN